MEKQETDLGQGNRKRKYEREREIGKPEKPAQ